MDKRSVAIIFDRLGPYHVARLKAAAGLLHVVAIEVCAMSDEYAWDRIDGVSGFQRKTLFAVAEGDSSRQRPASIRERIEAALHDAKPVAVFIPGWTSPAALAALRWCVLNKRPAILMSETTAFDEPRKWHREKIKGRIVRLFSAALVGGKLHADYLVALGLPPSRVFLGYDAVDNDYFARSAQQIRNQSSQVREKYHLPENYFLASARFIEKKNLPVLVRAYAEYRRAAGEDPWKLVLLGDGPLKSDLERLVSDLKAQDWVIMPGFKQYAELPIYYSLAGAFVHASTTEQWGLVVNEAMASRLPVLVSNRCGCAPELVSEAENGFSFDPTSPKALTELMLRAASIPAERRQKMGELSERIISGFAPEHFANGAERAVEMSLTAEKPRLRAFDALLLNILSSRWV